MALTWRATDGFGQSMVAMEGQRLVGQVVHYDGSAPPWAGFIHGERVGRGRFRTQDQAKAAVELAWSRRT